jgi:dipeptidase E
MKLLLTSAGVRNQSIGNALVALLGKPIEESNAVFIPTAGYGFIGGVGRAGPQLQGPENCPMTTLGWKSLGIVELTAIPSLSLAHWLSVVEEADAILVPGGNPYYLSYWMHESGFDEVLKTLRPDVVYFGFSAGSMVLTAALGDAGGDDTVAARNEMLGFVDFAICPHMDHPNMPGNSMAMVAEWAADLPCPGYGIDDDTAIQVVDGKVDIISEGNWRLFNA